MAGDRLADALKEALAAVEEAGIPDELREVAFAAALEHLLPRGAAGLHTEQQQQPDGAPPPAPAERAQVRGDDPIAKIARRLQIDATEAGRVFDVDEEGVHVIVQRARLADSRLGATQQIAQLVAAARQAAGLDEGWTSVDTVRKAVEQKGVLDAPNFARALNALDGQGLRLRGQRGNRELKMHDTGFEAAGELVRDLAGRG